MCENDTAVADQAELALPDTEQFLKRNRELSSFRVDSQNPPATRLTEDVGSHVQGDVEDGPEARDVGLVLQEGVRDDRCGRNADNFKFTLHSFPKKITFGFLDFDSSHLGF